MEILYPSSVAESSISWSKNLEFKINTLLVKIYFSDLAAAFSS